MTENPENVEIKRLRTHLATALKALRAIDRMCSPCPPRAPAGSDPFAYATGFASGKAITGLIFARWRLPRGWGRRMDDA